MAQAHRELAVTLRPEGSGAMSVDAVQILCDCYNLTTYDLINSSIFAYYHRQPDRRIPTGKSILIKGIPFASDLYEVINIFENVAEYGPMIISCAPAYEFPKQQLWITFVDGEQAERYASSLLSTPEGIEVICSKSLEAREIRQIFSPWRAVSCSLRIVEKQLILRLDNIPQNLYYREFIWIIDTEVEYQADTSGTPINKAGRNKIDFAFKHPNVNRWANFAPGKFPGTAEGANVDQIAYMISTGIEAQFIKKNCSVTLSLRTKSR